MINRLIAYTYLKCVLF